MSYRAYTEEDFTKAVEESKSIAEVLRKLDLAPVGGNYRTVHRKIADYKLDTTHFTGQLWSKGKSLKEIGSYKKRKGAKNALVQSRGHKCESCQLEKWLSEPIPLELHHIDGNSLNQEETNLQLLCPNCHSMTSNYRRKKGGLA